MVFQYKVLGGVVRRGVQMASKATIRIFISSPSDVRPERLIAERVIARLDLEFGHRIRVEALLWEREPLVASRHFQDIGNIPAPHTADIVVVIVWSRLGVLLPPDQFRGSISGRPVTGTEWEFEDALASARKDGTPPILFYRKQAESTTGMSDRAALQEKIEQLDRVDDFIGRWFRGTDGQTATAAWHSFSTTAEFEDRVYEHLHALLTKRLAGESGDTVRWQGSPFRGLESFEFEHAPVFFGRTRARSELREVLARQVSKGSAFVLVLGASGSGKSSLVKAGLIPDLMLPGMIGRVALCRRAVLRPGDQPDDLMRGLAAAIMAPTALPELARLRYTPERLADLLREAPKQAILPIEQGLAEAAKVAALTEIAEARLVLLVDQLEELFTIQTIGEEQRNAFVAALAALAQSGLVWVVATMRSDFFDRIDTVPALVQLASSESRYLLQQPDSAEIGQIIRRPAREAGVRFEFDAQRGISLNDEILRAAGNRSALPLLSFLLDQLWQQRTHNNELTFAAYRSLGGLEGALGRRATQVFENQSPEVQAALPRVLRALVTVASSTANEATARTMPISRFAENSAERKLVEIFLAPEARLFVADAEEGGNEPRIRVTHEALLTHWDRAREQITEDRADLELKARLEHAAARWHATDGNQRDSLLLGSGLPLSEAADYIERRSEECEDAVIEYVRCSSEAEQVRMHREREREEAILRQQVEAARRVARISRTFSAVAATLLVVAIVGGVIAWIQRNRAETSYAATFESTSRNFQIIDETLPTSSLPTEVAQRFLDNGLKTLKALGHDLDEAPRPERSSPAIAVLQLRLLALRAQTYIDSGRGREAIETATTMNKFAAVWAAAFPNNDELQFLLAVSFDRVGDGRNASDDIGGALDAYRRQEALVTRMLAAQPDNEVLQHRLFLALESIGDAQKWLGETAPALESYLRAEPIALRVTSKRPDDLVWQRDLGTLLPRIGDVLLAQGDVDGAIKRYQATHDLYLRLTKAQPRSADWRWGLMAAHRSIGDAKRARGDHDGALAEYKAFEKIASRLVDEDDQRPAWKQLLGRSFQRQGDILLAQGNHDRALTAYADYLSLVEPLARADRDNNNYHNDVSIGHARLGDVFMRIGRGDEALDNYQSYLERARTLAKKVPVHALWQRNWAIAHQRLGDALLTRNQPDKALDHFRACVAIPVKHPIVDQTNPEPRHVIAHCGQRIEQIASGMKQP
jgi:tetratricopeptide (TPR) repeat protein